jgi:predicted metal-dependent phosphoesterase TrpH
MIDLHMHSTASDGTDTPAVLIRKCAKLKLMCASITDHDTIDSQDEATGEAKRYGLHYLTGVEFSVRHEGELHILGYGVDIKDKTFAQELELLRAARLERVDMILQKLKEIGIPVSREDVIRNASGETLGRPHVALALMEKGYAADFNEAFGKYLNEGGSAYVQRRKLNPGDAITLIRNAGGISVLAHPKFIHTSNPEALIDEMKEMGLGGIEAFYPAHSDAEARRYEAFAKQKGLLVTAGSDYHGAMRMHSAIASERRKSKYLTESVQKIMAKYL